MRRRLAPVSILYRTGERLVGFAWIVILLAIGGQAGPDLGLGVPFAALAVVALLIAVPAYQLVYFRRFEYELTDDTFDIHSGVLSRRDREIPLRRIQNVDISRNVVQRALGVAEVRLETAGGSESEAQLQYVAETEARRLQDEIGRLKRGVEAGREGGAGEGPDGQPAEEPVEQLFAITPRELFLLGAVSLDLRIVPVLSVGLTLLAPSFAAQFDPFAFEQYPVVFSDVPYSSLLFGPLAFLVFYLLAAAVSGVIAVTNYYGFTLARTRDELRYERGLFQRYSGTIPLGKVQTLTVAGNVLARLIGYRSLRVETAGYGPGDESGSQSAVPFAERDRAYRLANEIERFGTPRFERPPKRARTRYVVRYTIVVLVLAAVWFGVATVLDSVSSYRFAWWLPLVLLPAAPVAAHLKWRNLGYWLGDDHVVTRAGFWVRTTRVVPYYRIQTVHTSQNVFQRRRELATLVLDTAGRSGLIGNDATALDIDAGRAAELRREVEDRFLDALAHRRDERRRARRAALAATSPESDLAATASDPAATDSDPAATDSDDDSDADP